MRAPLPSCAPSMPSTSTTSCLRAVRARTERDAMGVFRPEAQRSHRVAAYQFRMPDEALAAGVRSITAATVRSSRLAPVVVTEEYTMDGLTTALVGPFTRVAAPREGVEPS
jgi:hypothetical protein